MVNKMSLKSGSVWSDGITAFTDPRRGSERRAQWSRIGKRKSERRSRIVDRRVYCQRDAATPWWLLRGYVTQERFIDRAESCGNPAPGW